MRNLYFGLALAAVPLAHGHAQTPSTTSGGAAGELATVNVDASRTNGFVPTTVEAGTFRGTNLMEVPATVNTVTREVIELQGAAGVYDVLRNTAGVTQLSRPAATRLRPAGRSAASTVENRGNYRLNGSACAILEPRPSCRWRTRSGSRP
jgi:iron complex outermembrane receptor protein